MSRFEDAEGVTVADSTASFELEGAGGYLEWSTRSEGPEASGYATLDCANPVVAQVVFASIGSSGAPTGMATVFSSQAATVFQFPVLTPEATLGFAIANNGNAETSCRIALEDRQRTNLGEATLSVPAKSNRSQLLNAAIPIPETFLEGSATVACDRRVGMIGLHFELRPDASIITFNTLPNTVLDTSPQSEFTSAEDPFARWNDLEPQPWWRQSEPYSCLQEEKLTSPWLNAGFVDLGGSDPLSLIRYFGNGSYLRYGQMGFFGCTPLDKYPTAFHQDPPADPTYYSLGDLHIWVDIARVPKNASGWPQDDGERVEISMERAVGLLNQYVAPYFSRISQDNLRMVFHQGNEFTVEGEGRPEDAELQQFRLVGACLDGCSYGAPGGLNRILLDDVASNTGGKCIQWMGWVWTCQFPCRVHGNHRSRVGPRLDGLAALLFRGAMAASSQLRNPGSPALFQLFRHHVAIGPFTRSGLGPQHAINPGDQPLCRRLDQTRTGSLAPGRYSHIYIEQTAGKRVSVSGRTLRSSLRFHDAGSPRRTIRQVQGGHTGL